MAELSIVNVFYCLRFTLLLMFGIYLDYASCLFLFSDHLFLLFTFSPFFPLARYLRALILFFPCPPIPSLTPPSLSYKFPDTLRICCICDRQSAQRSEQKRLLRCTATRTPCRYERFDLSSCPVFSPASFHTQQQLSMRNLVLSPHARPLRHRSSMHLTPLNLHPSSDTLLPPCPTRL
jgi:hypothetical protein